MKDTKTITINAQEALNFMQSIRKEAESAQSFGLNTTADYLRIIYSDFCNMVKNTQ